MSNRSATRCRDSASDDVDDGRPRAERGDRQDPVGVPHEELVGDVAPAVRPIHAPAPRATSASSEDGAGDASGRRRSAPTGRAPRRCAARPPRPPRRSSRSGARVVGRSPAGRRDIASRAKASPAGGAGGEAVALDRAGRLGDRGDGERRRPAGRADLGVVAVQQRRRGVRIDGDRGRRRPVPMADGGSAAERRRSSRRARRPTTSSCIAPATPARSGRRDGVGEGDGQVARRAASRRCPRWRSRPSGRWCRARPRRCRSTGPAGSPRRAGVGLRRRHQQQRRHSRRPRRATTAAAPSATWRARARVGMETWGGAARARARAAPVPARGRAATAARRRGAAARRATTTPRTPGEPSAASALPPWGMRRKRRPRISSCGGLVLVEPVVVVALGHEPFAVPDDDPVHDDRVEASLRYATTSPTE